MKNFLKFLVVLILALGSVAGTCYMFYANITEQKDAFSYLNTFMNNAQKSEIQADFASMSTALNNRYNEHLATIAKLDAITHTLNAYMICSLDYGVDNNSIIAKFDEVQSIQHTLDDYLNEFNTKKDNVKFDKDQGGNDVFSTFSTFVVSYASAVKHMNKEIEDNIILNHNSDIKFELIELYCLTIKDCYTNTVTTSDILNVKNMANMKLLNEKFNLTNGLVQSSVDIEGTILSKYNNNFISAFDNLTNKPAFAKELANNFNIVGETIDSASSNVEKATYYLRKILG